MKYILFFLGLVFIGCQPDYVFHQSHIFPEGQWTYADSIRIDFDIQDTSKRYQLLLDIHHSSEYPDANLYVKLATIFPKGNRTEQVVSMELADKTGRWLGQCRGDQCHLSIPIQTNTWFPEPGTYGLLIEQYMRQDSIHFLEEVAFAIRESKSP